MPPPPFPLPMLDTPQRTSVGEDKDSHWELNSQCLLISQQTGVTKPPAARPGTATARTRGSWPVQLSSVTSRLQKGAGPGSHMGGRLPFQSRCPSSRPECCLSPLALPADACQDAVPESDVWRRCLRAEAPPGSAARHRA